MPYSATPTVATIIGLVKQHFSSDATFNTTVAFRSDNNFFAWLNEAMDEVYADCGYQLDQFSFTTVVDQREYAFSGAGSASTLPNTINEILRVDYDGSALTYRYDYESQVDQLTSDDASGTPFGFYERWDGGVRYLGFSCAPDAAVTIVVYTTRQAVVLTATTGIPAIDFDFYSLLKDILIYKCFEVMQKFDAADRWNMVHVVPGKRRLAGVLLRRQGKMPTEIRVPGAHEIFC